jgi:hypothetical protein
MMIVALALLANPAMAATVVVPGVGAAYCRPMLRQQPESATRLCSWAKQWPANRTAL